MKKLLGISAAILGLLALAGTSQAQTINWGTVQNMGTDTDILNNGLAFDAATFNSTAVTVNGVSFNPLPGGTDGKISIVAPNGFTNTAPYAGGTAAYGSLVSNVGFGFFQNGAVTISGLTTGDTYQVEAWTYYGLSGFAATTFTGSDTATLDPTTGQFDTGTFTLSSGTSEGFNFNFGTPNNYAMIDAISVRDITTAAPEPSSVALMGIGLAGMAFFIRRKHSKA